MFAMPLWKSSFGELFSFLFLGGYKCLASYIKEETPANVCTATLMPAAKHLEKRLTETEEELYLYSTSNDVRIGSPNPFSGAA